MPTFKFSKLVRDKIVGQQIIEGSIPSYHTLDQEAHKQELIKKIAEEAREIGSVTANEVAGEIADVQQALDDLCRLYKVSKAEVSAVQRKKRQQKGAFRKGLYVDALTIDETNKWVEYYRMHPDRYPEL